MSDEIERTVKYISARQQIASMDYDVVCNFNQMWALRHHIVSMVINGHMEGREFAIWDMGDGTMKFYAINDSIQVVPIDTPIYAKLKNYSNEIAELHAKRSELLEQLESLGVTNE